MDRENFIKIVEKKIESENINTKDKNILKKIINKLKMESIFFMIKMKK